MVTWTNWSGRQSAEPHRIATPGSESEIADAVTDAGARRWAVRAIGSSHSHSRVAASDGLMIELDGWKGVTAIDRAARTATLRAGTRIHEIGPALHRAGLALQNQGDIDRQSIAGATATGTHGTGRTLRSLSASITAVRLVLASGDIVECTADDEAELFQVARHSLGGVGLITELTLALRPAYRLHERLWKDEPDDVMGRIEALTDATRHFEFFWMPQGDWCACKSLDETDAEPDDLPDRQHERIGWSHHIISSTRDDRHTEMEYAVPVAEGPACFAELRGMIQRDFPELEWPLEYRTLRSDDIWISTARGRETVTISVHQDIALDDRPLFEACEEIFRRHDGRPHWGKVHYRTGADLAALHEAYADWWQVRDRYDPEGVFVTEDLAALRP